MLHSVLFKEKKTDVCNDSIKDRFFCPTEIKNCPVGVPDALYICIYSTSQQNMHNHLEELRVCPLRVATLQK